MEEKKLDQEQDPLHRIEAAIARHQPSPAVQKARMAAWLVFIVAVLLLTFLVSGFFSLLFLAALLPMLVRDFNANIGTREATIMIAGLMHTPVDDFIKTSDKERWAKAEWEKDKEERIKAEWDKLGTDKK